MKRPLGFVALLYGGGLILAECFQPPLLVLFSVSLMLAVLALVFGRTRSWLLVPLIVFSGWANLICRTAIVSPVDLRAILSEAPEDVVLRGTLVETPSERISVRDETESVRTLAELSVNAIKRNDQWQPAFGKVVVVTPGTVPADFFSGQKIEVAGIIAPPRPPLVDGLFDYQTYLRRQSIYFEMKATSPAEWHLLSTNRTPPLSDRFCSWAKATLARGLPVEDKPLRLMWAMTLGSKNVLTSEAFEPFVESGTMHIFAIVDYTLCVFQYWPMKQAYSFLRWSTKGQNKTNRDSQRRQTDSAEKWIAEHSNGEYQLSKNVFIADGKSGWKGEHIAKDALGKAKGELARFIEQIKDGTIASNSILLFDSWDRFSRLPVRKTIALLNDVVDNCGGIVVTGSRDKRVLTAKLLDEDEYLLSGIIGEVNRATHESAEKSRKIIASRQNKMVKMQAGEVLVHTNAPRYYTYNKDKKCYEQNKELIPIVKRIIDEFLGGKSLYQISNGLNADKVRSLRYFNKQANWSRMAIKALLETKCLYGEFLGIPNYFGEPVIDKPTWDKIQMILVRNSGNKGRYATDFVNIFRGIGICSACGRQMAIGVQVMNYKTGKAKSEPYRYLRCCARSNGMPCDNNSQMNLAEVERTFFIEFLSKNPIDLINGDEKEEMKKLERNIADKQTQLNKITEKVNALGALAGIIPTADLLKQGQALKAESTKLQAEIDALNHQKTSIMATPVSRDVFFKTTDLDTGEEDVEYLTYSEAEIVKNLKDNAARISLRAYLPNIISKIVFDTKNKMFKVFRRDGKVVFESEPVNKETIWKKTVKLSWRKIHRDAMKGMTPQEIQSYVKTLENSIRNQT